jgi:hypothetical protein
LIYKIYKNSVATSQRTQLISNQLKFFREKLALFSTVYVKHTFCGTVPDLILLQNVVRILTTCKCLVYRLVWLNIIPEEARRVTIYLGGKINNFFICTRIYCIYIAYIRICIYVYICCIYCIYCVYIYIHISLPVPKLNPLFQSIFD